MLHARGATGRSAQSSTCAQRLSERGSPRPWRSSIARRRIARGETPDELQRGRLRAANRHWRQGPLREEPLQARRRLATAAQRPR
eukprot:14551646-Alexandrium_andersonii.AAC.1